MSKRKTSLCSEFNGLKTSLILRTFLKADYTLFEELLFLIALVITQNSWFESYLAAKNTRIWYKLHGMRLHVKETTITHTSMRSYTHRDNIHSIRNANTHRTSSASPRAPLPDRPPFRRQPPRRRHRCPSPPLEHVATAAQRPATLRPRRRRPLSAASRRAHVERCDAATAPRPRSRAAAHSVRHRHRARPVAPGPRARPASRWRRPAATTGPHRSGSRRLVDGCWRWASTCTWPQRRRRAAGWSMLRWAAATAQQRRPPPRWPRGSARRGGGKANEKPNRVSTHELSRYVSGTVVSFVCNSRFDQVDQIYWTIWRYSF